MDELGLSIMERKYDYLFKLLVIGDSQVGKTELLLKFCGETLQKGEKPVTTIGVDFKVTQLNIEGQRVKIQLWDTCGQERFHSLTTAFFRGAMGIFFVYDMTQRTTFDSIKNWIENATNHCQDYCVKFLLANRCEFSYRRHVSKEEGEQLAEECSARYFEVSSRHGTKTMSALWEIANDILEVNRVHYHDRLRAKSVSQPIVETVQSPQTNCCQQG